MKIIKDFLTRRKDWYGLTPKQIKEISDDLGLDIMMELLGEFQMVHSATSKEIELNNGYGDGEFVVSEYHSNATARSYKTVDGALKSAGS